MDTFDASKVIPIGFTVYVDIGDKTVRSGTIVGFRKTTYKVSDFAGDLKTDREYLISWKIKTNTSTNEWYLMDKVHANAFEAFGFFSAESRS
jgi:hypothetical protein